MPWTELLIGLVGTVFGFALAAGWEYFKDSREKREEASNIRRILTEEIRYNKAVLKEVHDLVTKEYEQYKATGRQDSYGQVIAEGDPWRTMGSFSPSRITSEAWSSQLHKVPSALNRRQIAELMAFHRNLAEIQALQTSYLAKLSNGSRSLHEPMMRILNLMEETVGQRLSIEQ